MIKLKAGVTGNGIRTMPLSFKASVNLSQVVGQSLAEWEALFLQFESFPEESVADNCCCSFFTPICFLSPFDILLL